MNAIEDNDFTEALRRLGQSIPKPKAILCVSAHWMTQGTWVTHMPKPRTIHDFGGFPQELFDVQYPALGSPGLAEQIQTLVRTPKIQLDDTEWGLDHGAWAVLRKMYPQADVPVVQLSLDMQRAPEFHFQLGEQLQDLRNQGILILASGNIVHNLRKIEWEADAKPYDWALEFDEWVKQKLLARDSTALMKDFLNSSAGKLSVPTMDHWFPLYYAMGAATPKDEVSFPFEGIQNASIAMRLTQWQ